MKILLTGASSFTGYWIARALAGAGHHVIAPLRRAPSDYEGVRARRVQALAGIADLVPETVFGDSRFMDLAGQGFDLFCHHAAQVGDYRSADFDIAAAVAANTANLRPILQRLGEKGLRAAILTGSVFEANEGIGEPPLRAFSAYGLSKGLTDQIFSFHCTGLGLPAHKFVIPNPFGPFEEPRFTAYLIRNWKAGQSAVVNTPAYVRDNIHADLLAAAYAGFVSNIGAGNAPARLNPSGYVETQGAFAGRFAAAMRPRLGLACAVSLATQRDFPEPRIRINMTPATAFAENWNEDAAWDLVAEFYG